jgi:hypothetical protein
MYYKLIIFLNNETCNSLSICNKIKYTYGKIKNVFGIYVPKNCFALNLQLLILTFYNIFFFLFFLTVIISHEKNSDIMLHKM